MSFNMFKMINSFWKPIMVLCLLQKISCMHIERAFTNDQLVPSFEKPVINTKNGQIILGAKNRVYKLSPELKLLQQVNIGPRVPAGQQSSVNVFVKGLVLDEEYGSLIICSTIPPGSCQIVSFDNLDEVKRPFNGSVVSNDPTSPNVLFLGEGADGNKVLFVGSWYGVQYGPQATEYLTRAVPLVSSRNPLTLELLTTSSGVQSSVFTKESDETEPHLKFIYGFSYGNFVYFISRYKLKESRIIRLCKSNLSIDTYVDVPVVCDRSDHSVVQDAEFEESSGILYIVFRKLQGEETRLGLVSSVVCQYKMSEVERQFNRVVDDCHKGQGQLGPYYIHEQVQCPTVAGKIVDPYCSKAPDGFASIEGLQPIMSLNIIKLDNVYLYSITVIPQNSSTIIIANSGDGFLRKYIKSGSSIKEVDKLHIDNMVEGIGMSVSLDKKSVYVVTSDMVLKVKISHCEHRTTCQECVSTFDPVCGWCNTNNRCEEKKNCPDSLITPSWLSSAKQESCAKMSNLQPSILNYENISRNQDQHKISFQLTDATLSGGKSDLQCAFTALSVTAHTAASLDNDVITCLLPSNRSLGLKPKDHHNLEVEFHVEGSALVKRSVPVFDCTVHRTCTDCSKSSFNCTWHYQTHSCSALSFVSLRPSAQDPSTTSFDNCPRVEIPASQNADIIVHSGDSPQLVVKLVNMKADQTNEMWCRFRYLGKEVTVPGKEEAGSLTCQKAKFEYSQETSNVDATFEVLWGSKKYPLDMPRNTTVQIFKCKYMVTNCGLCLTMDTKYNCGWCSPTNQCSRQKECQEKWLDRDDTCPNPKILRFEPSKGPVHGRTNITVSGINLGKAYVDIKGGVKVAGVNCMVHPGHFESSQGFKCLTEKVDAPLNGTITVEVDNLYNTTSDSIFSFVIPKVIGMGPKKGPQSGGTTVKIFGGNMNIGTLTTVDISGSPCIVTKVTRDEIMCMTSKSVNGFGEKEVEVDFGGYKRLLTDKFIYKQDPVITYISRYNSTASGGMLIQVCGKRLDLIQRRQIFLEGHEELAVNCEKKLSKLKCLKCPTPPLTLSHGERISVDQPRLAHYGLLLDNVQKWKNVSRHTQFNPFYYYPDPVLEKLPDKISYKDIKSLVIKGSSFSVIYPHHDLKVLVGTDYCNNILLSPDNITCTPPEEPEGMRHGRARVTVEFGNFREDVGYLTYTEEEISSSPDKPIAMGIILGVVIPMIAIIALLAICIIRRQRKNKPPDGAIPELLKDNEQDEEKKIKMNNLFVKADMNGQIANGDSGPYINELLSRIEDEALQQNISDFLIYRSKLNVGDLIGKGNYGSTSQGLYKNSKGADSEEQSDTVAIKTLQGCSTDNETIDGFLKLCAVLKDLQHPNILTVCGVCLSVSEPPMIILPNLQRGDLKNYIKDSSKNVALVELLEIAQQVSEAMSYLEGIRVIHGNLAARNCLVTDDKVVKLSDYSIASLYSGDFYLSNDNISITKWWAPEILNIEKGTTPGFNHKTDCWSYGIVLWELMTRGVTPYPDVETENLLKYLTGGHRLKKPRQSPEAIYLLMLKCWTDVPSDRPTFQEISEEIKQFTTAEESNDVSQPLQTKVDLGESQEYLGVMG
ncbi:plexin-A4-like isoform X3 [Ostrea edulis]|uniref:plexin-A4-like isoform X3 n=1 Tax=Ostrea edulis TaxID=37623 RepID=UPI0024AEFBA3|nr:plexin-A4-like isoform X3 [Ostrea edulis]XP_056001236.1 plexin-A4-like isoform X3 [Ostrea edulis]